MDTVTSEVMRLCSLTHDKEVNMVGLPLKELSVTINSELKDPKASNTSNTSHTN